MNKIYYFDHAATTMVKEEVLKEMIPYFTISYGNASSIYNIGRNAKYAVECSRSKIAKAIGANEDEIYFVSCGSEADNLAIKGICLANSDKGKHIITSKIEHPAVLNTCKSMEKQGFNVTYLNVNKNGEILLQELENSIRSDTILISIMYANNEIGTIQPIEQIAKIAKKHNIIFHTDAVQAVGNVYIDVKGQNIDALSMSGHKFYGPKGIGALYIRSGINFEKIQDGGHQEKDKRAGTENVPGIVGMSKAIEIANKNLDEHIDKLTTLRNYLISEIETYIPNAILNGDRTNRLAGNVNFSFPNADGQELLLKLDAYGICTSSGSACSSGQESPSHVLTAIGLNQNLAKGTIRISLGDENTLEDVDYLIEKIKKIVNNKN